MPDLTVIYITANEMPTGWQDYHMVNLRLATAAYPMVVVSREAMTLGRQETQYIVENNPKSYWNIYTQMLAAAKLADTPYVAMAEDDTLYPESHFREFRPVADMFAYNRSRWSLFSWDPMYCLRQRISNCTLIAPRELLIEALEERAAKHPNGADNRVTGELGRWKVAHWLGVTNHPMVEWWSTTAVVQLNHPTGSDDRQSRKWKKHGQLKATDIPHWGKATDIVREYHGTR